MMREYKIKVMRLFGGCRKPSIEAARQYVADVRDTAKGNRVILTAEDIFAARELLPVVLDAYDSPPKRGR